MWHVYILVCSKDNSLYIGITTNVERRIKEHNGSKRGAKYTRSKRPVKLLKSFEVRTKSDALKLEYKIKQLTRDEKIKLCNGERDDIVKPNV